MRHITRVKSPIKGGVDVRLGKRTVLVGPNGAGKTAVVQAIELATIATVTDIEGRDKAARSAVLARLFPPEGPFTSRAEWSDGAVHSWEMEARKDGFKRPTQPENPFPVQFPIRDLRAVLGSADASVRAWIESNIFTQISEDDILRSVGSVHEKATRKLMTMEKCTDFLTLAKAGKSKSRSLKTEATGKEKTIEEMMTGVNAPLLSMEKHDLTSRLAELRADNHGVSQAEYERVGRELEEARQALQKTQEAIAQLEGALGGASGASAAQKLQRVLKHLDEATHLVPDGKVCLVCGTADVASTRETRRQAIQSKLAEFERETKLQAALDAQRAALATKEQAVTDKETWLQTTEVKPNHDAEIHEIQSKLNKSEMDAKAWENADRTRTTCANLRKRAQEYGEAAARLDEVGRRLIDSRKVKFTKRISKYLSFGDAFDVDLDTSRIGLSRRGQLHTALSGVEESRVLLALAADAGNSDSILVPPDRAWDKRTLTETMRALKEVDSQIIIMSTVRPDPIPGWDILDIR